MPDDSKPPHQPGAQRMMSPQPEVIRADCRGAGKRAGKVAIVTGGDSGSGRSIAVQFAREDADRAILYLQEHKDAQDSLRMIEAEGVVASPLPAKSARAPSAIAPWRAAEDIRAATDFLVDNAAAPGIRVNGVAPRPICTPLIPATFPEETVEKHADSAYMS